MGQYGELGREIWSRMDLGIYYNFNKLSETTDININAKTNDIEKLIRTWSTRVLTPHAKVARVKSLLTSKITHILLSLPSPSSDIFGILETLFLNFIWDNTPAKFNKIILEAEVKDGGLKLHNLSLFDQAL